MQIDADACLLYSVRDLDHRAPTQPSSALRSSGCSDSDTAPALGFGSAGQGGSGLGRRTRGWRIDTGAACCTVQSTLTHLLLTLAISSAVALLMRFPVRKLSGSSTENSAISACIIRLHGRVVKASHLRCDHRKRNEVLFPRRSKNTLSAC